VITRVGDTITVHLGPASSVYRWSDVVSSDDRVLRRTGGAVESGGVTVTATFIVAATGAAQLTATEDPHCAPVACGAPSRLWMVRVNATT
jgi:hypothetical protein